MTEASVGMVTVAGTGELATVGNAGLMTGANRLEDAVPSAPI